MNAVFWKCINPLLCIKYAFLIFGKNAPLPHRADPHINCCEKYEPPISN